MGRSTASCLRIITCGSDAADKDDYEAAESKGSSEKRGWSFRKRSARHRVLSNTVISEMPSNLNEENPETASSNLQTQPNMTSPEKTSALPCKDERPQLPTSMNLNMSDALVATEDDIMHDLNPDESVIVVIQTAIRGLLAQREMLKRKNVVKLQAAVRGHLVRRQAVGTLRCVQAIIKMQALIRARRARLSSEGSFIEGKLDGNHAKDYHSSKLLGKGNSVSKPIVVYTSIEKLLSNKFAYQVKGIAFFCLLQLHWRSYISHCNIKLRFIVFHCYKLMHSTPRTKRLHIRCDPSRSDSSWNWLERWMSVSSMGAQQPQKPESRSDKQEQEKTGFQSEGCESTNLKAKIRENLVHSNSEENLITYEAYNFYSQRGQPALSSQSDYPECPRPENSVTPKSKECLLDFLPDQTRQSDSISQMELMSVTSIPGTEGERSTHSVIKLTPEQVEAEGEKPVFGTRNTTNPPSSCNQDIGVESNLDAAISSGLTREIGLVENSDLHTSRDRVGGSECGTELSISSTLDSPDRYEIGGTDVEQGAKHSEEGTSNPNGTKIVDIEANDETSIPGSDLSNSITVQPEKLDSINGEPFISVTALDSLEEKQKSEISESTVLIKLDSEMGYQMCKSSPEASPRSHITIPISQGTPSSQVSVKAKRTKSDKGASNHKRKSSSADKRSPSNPSQDHLPREQKTAKRRNSFGSGGPDNIDQNPRDSTSSYSLPNYMQATESARAKALANSSPRSSPDMQDKDIYIRKRHSLPLPGANGRQGSPRVQRSTSRTQQCAKENGHLHEKKWQR